VDRCKGGADREEETNHRIPPPPPRTNNAASPVVSPARNNTAPAPPAPPSSAPQPPAGWETRTDPSGRVYYLNHNTKTTHWELPANISAASNGLPQGWEERRDGNGRVYYVDHANQTTHWELPGRRASAAGGADQSEFRSSQSLIAMSSSQSNNPLSLLQNGRYVRAHPAFANPNPRPTEWIQINGLRQAHGHPDINTADGQFEYTIMQSLPPPLGSWNRMKDAKGHVWMAHKDDLDAVKRFSTKPVHEIAQLPFKDKRLWFEQQMLRIRTPATGATEITLRRSNLTEDSWNKVSALNVQQMRSDWSFGFEGETNSGDDAGGITREWFESITGAVFNEGVGLFKFTESHNLAYQINDFSGDLNGPQHLVWLKFTGRMMGKALFDGHPLKAHLAPTLYKHMLQVPIKMEDLKGIENERYNSMVWMKDNPVQDVFYETFTAIQKCEAMGIENEIELKPGGKDIDVTDDNKSLYMDLYLKWRVYGSRKEQIKAFLGGFWEVVPVELLQAFDWQQLELVMCGMPKIDVADWKANTLYNGDYTQSHKVIKMFWEALESLEQEDRAKLLQFVTSSSVVPVDGFAGLQAGQGEPCKFTIEPVRYTGKKKNNAYTNQLPKAHTCFNKLDLPLYPNKEVLVNSLKIALYTEAIGFTMEE